MSRSKNEQKLVRSKVLRIILICVGFISFGLGTVGIFLPVLPTTPLYLLTSYCFVRSSKRFNNWFLNTKLYKKHLENFAETKSMIIYNELILLLSVSAILICVIWFVNNIVVTCILVPVIALKYGYFVAWVKPISKPEFKDMMAERKLNEKLEELQLQANETTIDVVSDENTLANIINDNEKNNIKEDKTSNDR